MEWGPSARRVEQQALGSCTNSNHQIEGPPHMDSKQKENSCSAFCLTEQKFMAKERLFII